MNYLSSVALQLGEVNPATWIVVGAAVFAIAVLSWVIFSNDHSD